MAGRKKKEEVVVVTEEETVEVTGCEACGGTGLKDKETLCSLCDGSGK